MGLFLFATASSQALEHTQSTIQWVPGAITPRVKRPGPEFDHPLSRPSAWSYTSTPLVRLPGVVLS